MPEDGGGASRRFGIMDGNREDRLARTRAVSLASSLQSQSRGAFARKVQRSYHPTFFPVFLATAASILTIVVRPVT